MHDDFFGQFLPTLNGGVNPPYAPAYPHEWTADCHRIDIVATVDTDYVDHLLSFTPFTRVGDCVIFRFAEMRRHTLAIADHGFTETMVVAPVRYKSLLTCTYVFHYTDDEVANIAGRELLGYSKKDAATTMTWKDGGDVSGRTVRRGVPLAEFSFTTDPSAPMRRVVDGAEPVGSIHVRRLPYPDHPGDAYADVVFRQYRLAKGEAVPGYAELTVHESTWDPISKLDPTVVSASYVAGDFGGSLETEHRAILEVLQVPTPTPLDELLATTRADGAETIEGTV